MTIHQIVANHFNINAQRIGEWQSVNCPFHDDSTASAGIILLHSNSDKCIFNCQAGCGIIKGKDLIDRLNLNSNNLNEEGEQTIDIMDDWMRSFLHIENKEVSIKKQVIEYSNFLIEKKLTHEIITKFNGEYISDIKDKLYGYLRFNYGKKKNRSVARRLLPITEANEPRFYNSHGNKTLFGQETLSNANTYILCEGITDYLSLQSLGIENAVASFGAEVSNNQMYLLKGKTVFIIFDCDYAGYEGAKKASELLKKFDATPIILELPSYLSSPDDEKIDINTCYCYNSNNLKSWIEQQMNKYSMFDQDYISNFVVGKSEFSKYWKSNIDELDEILCGGFATGVHTIGGEPGSGKSTLIAYLEDVFTQQGAKVLSCSYELAKQQKYARLASRRSNYSWTQIEKGEVILEENVQKYLKCTSNLLRIDTDWSLSEIKHAADNFDIIIVDYIQRMYSPESDERQRIKDNINGLSNISRYKNKVIIVVSSISRTSYGNPASMGIFKETGSIEFVSQSCYKIAKINANCLKLDIIKNTRGIDGGCIFLKADFQHQTLASMDIMEDMK